MKRADYKQFCWYMGMDSFFLLRLQRASLFIHLYPERCSGLYSYWGFAPSLLKCNLPIICRFAPSLLVTSAAQCFDYALLPIRCVICMRIAYYDFVSLICWIQVSIICWRQDYALVAASLRLCSNLNSQIICSFAQSLPIIVAVAQCHVAGIIFNRVHCISTNTGYCILASTDSCMLAKTGWKPKKNLAQSNALGTVAHLFCALKEQKEGGSVPTTNNFVDVWVCNPFPFALTARQLAYASLPRALLWAVFLLGLRPVFAQMWPPKLFAGLPRLRSKHLLHNIQWYTPVGASIRNCVKVQLLYNTLAKIFSAIFASLIPAIGFILLVQFVVDTKGHDCFWQQTTRC